MSKGMDIKIKGVTVGHHFDMIRIHCADKTGDLDWYLLLKGGNQVVTERVWGHTYKVVFSYCSYDDILVAECIR